jgi:hypothetical protein
VEEVKSNLPPR